MGLLREILMVPLAPVRLTHWTVGQLVDAAERAHYGPAAIRQELADLYRRLDEGAITPEEFDVQEDQLLERMAEGQRRGISG
jgi:Gas vesicle protein G